MAKKVYQNVLGRNLGQINSSLQGVGAVLGIPDVKTDGSLSMNEIPISEIEANAEQPRTSFDQEKLEELAMSIREHGIIQPLTVRKVADHRYQIISGERRFRASKLAGLTSVPAYIRTVDDEKVVEMMALIENIQREDLNAIEIALSFQKLSDLYKLTQEELSKKVGKKRETISNYLRLLKLPAHIQLALKNKTLDMGHARSLITIDDPSKQLAVYELIVKENLSVRKVEEIVRQIKNGETPEMPTKSGTAKKDAPAEYEVLRKKISSCFNKEIQFAANEKGKGKITIPFKNIEELEQIMEVFDRMSAK